MATLRSNDVDSYENIKKTIGFISKNNNFARASHFTFLCPFLHDYDMKLPNFMFYGGPKQATMKFYFSF